MKLYCEGVLLSAEQKEFTPVGDLTPKKWWTLKISDPESDSPFSVKMHKELGDRVMGVETSKEKYVGKKCTYTVAVTYWNNSKKLEVQGIEVSKE